MNTTNFIALELVQGQQHSTRVKFSCGNCRISKEVTRSSFLTRKSNSKSGILFCSPRCSAEYRRNQKNKKEESAKEILDNWFKKPSIELGEGIDLGGVSLVTSPPEFFLFGEGESNLIALSEQEISRMASEESMSQEELVAAHPELAGKIKYVVVDGKVNMVLDTGDGASPIPPTAPPAPQAPAQPNSGFTAPSTLNINSGSTGRQGRRYSWEYSMNGSTVVMNECDAGYHVIPEGFEAVIAPDGDFPGGAIWELQGLEKVKANQPLARCVMNIDEFSGLPVRTFINVIGLAQWGTPEFTIEPNTGQYRPATTPCQRCMGLDSKGMQISKGTMTTRNLSFNWGYDKTNKFIPEEMPFDGVGSYLAQRGLMLDTTGKLAIPAIIPSTPPQEPNPF